MSDDNAVALTEKVDALTTEVAQLKDLFLRRLMDDKGRTALYESLQAELKASQDLLKFRAFESLFREALLAIDRLQADFASPDLVESAVEELLEVFARRTLVAVDDSGDFDPSVHEAVATIPATPQAPPRSIVAVHRTGYLLDDRLLRPAQVTIAVEVVADAPAEPETADDQLD